MNILYRDDNRKQLLAYDTMDNDFREQLHQFFNKRKHKFFNRKFGWMELIQNLFNPLIYNPFRLSETFTYNNIDKGMKYENIIDNIISMSLSIIDSNIGLDSKINIKENTVKFKYFEIKMEANDEEYDYDKQHYYAFNETEYENNYGVVYCIKKDHAIKDGNLTIYPHFTEENTLSKLFSSMKEIAIPTTENSIIIMNGTTIHNVPRISGTGTIQLLYVIFHNDL
jgi:hypothetical protein